MPHLVVNMEFEALIKVGCKLKVSNFKLRHAPYSKSSDRAITSKFQENKINFPIVNKTNTY